MRRRLETVRALFDPARGGPRLAGFLFGIALPLVLVAVISAASQGGLSDTRTPPAPVYVIE